VLFAALLLSCDPLSNIFEPQEAAWMYETARLADASPPNGPITVMTWNIKFGGARLDFFFDCIGDVHTMKKSQVEAHLAAIARKIEAERPDVVFLQEADVNAKRSAYVDQVQYLLDHTYLNYGAYASHWRVEFIPYEELGRMDSGNAILSRWPVADAVRIALPLRTDQSELTRQHYLKRNMLRAVVEIPEVGPLTVINTHAVTYSHDDTKRRHLRLIKQEMDAAVAREERFVGGGDFNAQPPGSAKWTDYPDSVCEDADLQGDDHTGEKDWLVPFYREYEEAIPLEAYMADNTPYFTHSVSAEPHPGLPLYQRDVRGWASAPGGHHVPL
jgi:endonuclease/exonuclease/phosphatase family metal-dependent hydrolase